VRGGRQRSASSPLPLYRRYGKLMSLNIISATLERRFNHLVRI
jgi:hypothetical protein